MDPLHTILCLPAHLQLEEIIPSGRQLILVLQSQTQAACCPDCGEISHHVHSHYWRTLQHLPLGEWAVELQIRLVRFRCCHSGCNRQTFVERLDPYARRYSRRTQRVCELLTHLGFELGGQGGKRIADLYQLKISRSTLLRLVRGMALLEPEKVRVLGVDDWALCRGERYGTILVDLERQHVIDLLPDTEANTLAQWLQKHPEVEIISRDRAFNYAEGASQGSPQALQIADRWHLFKNLWDALVVIYTQQMSQLNQLTTTLPSPPVTLDPTLPAVRHLNRPPTPPSPIQQARTARRLYWETVFAEVHHLRDQGVSKPAIARQLGVSLSLVKKYCRMDHLPKKQSPKFKPRLIDPYQDFIQARLLSGPVTTTALWQELVERGFKGSRSTVHKAMVEVRQISHLPSPLLIPKPIPPTVLRVTPQRLASWIFARELSDPKQELLQSARDLHPTIEMATGLAQDFIGFVRQHKPHHLVHWIEAVQLTDLGALKQFAQGLLRDFDAVYAACCQPWSNGQVEGQVNRLKFIKRQMYGRAHFDLLRLRVLYDGKLCT